METHVGGQPRRRELKYDRVKEGGVSMSPGLQTGSEKRPEPKGT